MNRDPFDSLRSRNPAPPESLPDAPMAVATAITSGHRSRQRGPAIAAATAAVVLIGGGAWLLWSRGGTQETAVAVTTTVAASAPVTAPAAASEAPGVVVYFLDAETSTLVPVARDLNVLDVRPLPPLGPLTLDLLLFGPGAWDAAPLPDAVAVAEAELTSSIPQGTELLGLEVADGVAMIDLSRGFAGPSPQALAQVVFTATRLDGVEAVRFLIQGEPHWVVADTLALVPADQLPIGATIIDPVTRTTFASLLPMVMVENPALGGSLQLPALVTGLTAQGEATVLLQLVAEDGTLLWSGTAEAPCDECPAGRFAVEIPASAAAGTGWVTLQAYLSTFDRGPLAEYPLWLAPEVTPGDEAELPEATTTTIPKDTTTITGNAAPWSGEPLPGAAVPAVALDTWAGAANADRCALLFPADPAALAEGAVLHDRYFGGGWGLAWDLPSGPGRWEPGGEYCPNCGREAFGVAGTGGEMSGAEDSIWANRLEWTAGPDAGSRYSHAGYGYEGLSSGQAGEPLLAYLFIEGQGCMYNVWSYLGEEHLLRLIDELRFVAGMGAP